MGRRDADRTMDSSNLAELAGLARELGLASEASLASRRAAVDDARARLERLRRYAEDYRHRCGVGHATRDAEALRRHHGLIGHLDSEIETLADTVARLERELGTARAERRRHRSSETALDALHGRAARDERAAEAKRDLDALDAACAMRAAAATSAARDATGVTGANADTRGAAS